MSGLLIPAAVAIGSLAVLVYLMTTSAEVDEEQVLEESLGSIGSVTASWDGSADALQSTDRRVKRVVPPDERSKKNLRNRLIQAGLYRKNSKGHFFVVQLLLASLPFGAAIMLARFGIISNQVALLAGMTVAIAGLVFPGLWLDSRKSARQTAIRRSLPDALDVIVVCVEAGLSMDASIQRVSTELRSAHRLLSKELAIVHKEIQLGTNIGVAIKHFADRFDLEELRSLSAVVQQAERFGSSIATALRVHAETLREKRLQAARERAQKAAVVLLLPTVICIFPAMFVVILGPAVYRVIEAMGYVLR